MKNTEVQTPGELRMRNTANWGAGLFVCVNSWSPASSSRRVRHWLVTVVDSMRESIHTICCDFLSPQGTQERARSQCTCFHSILSQKNRPFVFQARVDRRLVANSARISVDTDRQGNPRCACAPRVNYAATLTIAIPCFARFLCHVQKEVNVIL